MKVLGTPRALLRRLGSYMPQVTVGTRLTILYSVVFLLCGAALLTITTSWSITRLIREPS